MTDQTAKQEELRQRARALEERGIDVTQWLEEQLAREPTEAELTALEVELAAREMERGKLLNTRWLIGFVWIFVLVVIIVHYVSR